MDRPSFVAILYVNRSGSTLFSRMLSDNSPMASVLPELGFPVRFLLARRFGERLSGDAICDAIQEDPRFDALGISATRLRTVCAGQSSDDLARLFHALAREFAGGPVDTIVFKLETLLYVADEAVAAFPGLRFIHLHRDPRAVANSMIATPVPEKPGFDMARGSLIYAAAHWARYVRAVQQLAARHSVVSIRYEDLETIAEHDALAAMKLFLCNGMRNKAYPIAALDAPLHTRIYDEFDPARKGGWQRELTKDQIAAVEAICFGLMRDMGYALEGPSSPRRTALWPFYLRHGLAMIRHYWGTLLIYLADRRSASRLRDRLCLLWRS